MKRLSESIFNAGIERNQGNDIKQEEEIKYHPQTREELIDVLIDEMKKQDTDFIDYRKIDVSKINDMHSVFTFLRDFKFVKTIDVTGWDTSNVKNMHELFHWCTSLETIIGLETWNVEKVEKMDFIFANCFKLENINLDTWTLSIVATKWCCTNYMFLSSPKLNYEIQGNKLIKI